jgi:hypothetical protein
LRLAASSQKSTPSYNNVDSTKLLPLLPSGLIIEDKGSSLKKTQTSALVQFYHHLSALILSALILSALQPHIEKM